MLDVPEVVRKRAIAAGAQAWLDDLPETVTALEREWGFRTGEVFRDGSEALVARVTTTGGEPAVLKVLMPLGDEALEQEITTLRLADGDGCVALLRADDQRGVMLLEALGPSLADLEVPPRRCLEILCATAQRVWRPAPDSGLPTGAGKGRWLSEFVERMWEETDRACPRAAVDHALECARRRVDAHDDERAVLVHGDVHRWNALRADDGFKLVDPDGMLAEPEYDLGILMREDPELLLDGDPRERAWRLARWTGLDPLAIWEWGVVERVATGLLCSRIELQPVGARMLEVAERVVHLQAPTVRS